MASGIIYLRQNAEFNLRGFGPFFSLLKYSFFYNFIFNEKSESMNTPYSALKLNLSD